jgi:hypothetical protein
MYKLIDTNVLKVDELIKLLNTMELEGWDAIGCFGKHNRYIVLKNNIKIIKEVN